MAKGGGKSQANLLRVSGIIFAISGMYHLVRYFTKDELQVARIQLTYFGSFLVGLALLALAVLCFMNSKK